MIRYGIPLLATGLALGLSCQSTPPATTPTPAASPQSALGGTTLGAPLGVYRLEQSSATGEFALTPLMREGQALADAFAVDITEIAGPLLRLKGFSLEGPTTVRVNMGFAHPLSIPATRTDLHVFDVRLHVISGANPITLSGADGMQAPTGVDGALEDVSISGAILLNGDGFSSWGDEVVEPAIGEMTPTIYPFKRFGEDPGRGAFDPATPAGWNVFPMNETEYTIDLDFRLQPGDPIDVVLALECAYGQSATGPRVTPINDPGGRLAPRYFVPEFNLKEAWKADVVVTGTPTVGSAATAARLSMTVMDHQGAMAATGAFDALTAPQSSLRFPSNLKEVKVAVPGALPTPITIPGGNFSGSGTPTDPYTLDFNLTGDLLVGDAGTYTGIVAFRDEMEDSAGNLAPLALLGYTREEVLVTRYDFATYRVFSLTTEVSTNAAPTAELIATPTTVEDGGTTDLSPGAGTMDPDGNIVLFEYDFNYDGITFTVDASNMTGDPETSPLLSGPANITMALRVTDDGAPALSDIDSVLITVNPGGANIPPIADLAADPTVVDSGTTTELSPGAGTMDPDGSIVQYEYDFEYDGVTFTVDASNTTGLPVTSPVLTNMGASPIFRTMAMRVTDNGAPALQDIDDIEIEINPGNTAPTWTAIHAMIQSGDPNVTGDQACISCHIGGSGGLFMTADRNATYLNLVNQMSSCGDDYIEPSNTATSFLYHKISTPDPDCGQRMPRSGPPYWSQTAIDMVRDWILDGAPNN